VGSVCASEPLFALGPFLRSFKAELPSLCACTDPSGHQLGLDPRLRVARPQGCTSRCGLWLQGWCQWPRQARSIHPHRGAGSSRAADVDSSTAARDSGRQGECYRGGDVQSRAHQDAAYADSRGRRGAGGVPRQVDSSDRMTREGLTSPAGRSVEDRGNDFADATPPSRSVGDPHARSECVFL